MLVIVVVTLTPTPVRPTPVTWADLTTIVGLLGHPGRPTTANATSPAASHRVRVVSDARRTSPSLCTLWIDRMRES